jgi:predicted dehydrogenase
MAAVCDNSDSLTKSLKRFADVQIFSDPARMFADAKLDFVLIATPTASHAELADMAVKAGVHVFLEKPFVLSMDDGRRLAEAVEKAGLVNHVGYFLRFCPVFNLARDLLAQGLLGEVKTYQGDMFGRTVLRPSKASWRAAKKTGGGCILDFGSHCLDQADYLFGPVRRVSGSHVHAIYSTEVEDGFFSTLEHDNKVTGIVHVNWSDESYRRPYNRLEVFGTEGKIVADRQELRIYLRKARPDAGFGAGWSVKYLPEIEKGVRFTVRGADYTDQLDDFVDCIKNRRRSRCTFADALRTDAVIEQIRHDAAH